MKCCQNCGRSGSITSTGTSSCYCHMYGKYVNPSGCCPLHIPNGKGEEKAEDEQS